MDSKEPRLKKDGTPRAAYGSKKAERVAELQKSLGQDDTSEPEPDNATKAAIAGATAKALEKYKRIKEQERARVPEKEFDKGDQTFSVFLFRHHHGDVSLLKLSGCMSLDKFRQGIMRIASEAGGYYTRGNISINMNTVIRIEGIA